MRQVQLVQLVGDIWVVVLNAVAARRGHFGVALRDSGSGSGSSWVKGARKATLIEPSRMRDCAHLVHRGGGLPTLLAAAAVFGIGLLWLHKNTDVSWINYLMWSFQFLNFTVFVFNSPYQ